MSDQKLFDRHFVRAVLDTRIRRAVHYRDRYNADVVLHSLLTSDRLAEGRSVYGHDIESLKGSIPCPVDLVTGRLRIGFRDLNVESAVLRCYVRGAGSQEAVCLRAVCTGLALLIDTADTDVIAAAAGELLNDLLKVRRRNRSAARADTAAAGAPGTAAAASGASAAAGAEADIAAAQPGSPGPAAAAPDTAATARAAATVPAAATAQAAVTAPAAATVQAVRSAYSLRQL